MFGSYNPGQPYPAEAGQQVLLSTVAYYQPVKVPNRFVGPIVLRRLHRIPYYYGVTTPQIAPLNTGSTLLLMGVG